MLGSLVHAKAVAADNEGFSIPTSPREFHRFHVGQRVRLSAYGRRWELPNWTIKSETGTVTSIVTQSGDIILVQRDGVARPHSGVAVNWEPLSDVQLQVTRDIQDEEPDTSKATPAMLATAYASDMREAFPFFRPETLIRAALIDQLDKIFWNTEREREVARALRTEGTLRDGLASEHTLTLHLSKTQWGMLRQAARHDGKAMEQWVVSSLGRDVASLLEFAYGHDTERAEAGWDGAPRPQHERNEPRSIPSYYNEQDLARLAKLAAKEGTDLQTQYNRVVERGTNRTPGFPMHASLILDVFHADLLRAFERRNGIDANTYARAVVEWHAEELFDVLSNGGDTERNTATGIRDFGNYCELRTPERLAMLCRAVQLNPADYPEAVESEDDTLDEQPQGQQPATGHVRRHAHDPADVALLAAAKPEAVADLEDDEPIIEEEHVEEPPQATTQFHRQVFPGPRNPEKVPVAPVPGVEASVWLSSEYMTWCESMSIKPVEFAPAALHTLALENPRNVVVISDDPSRLYNALLSEEPLPEEEHVEGDDDKEDDHAGEEWKEGK